MSALTAITMHPVTSSQIAAIGHAPELNVLAIQFPPNRSGAGSLYHYQNVSAEMFAEFLAAESQGSFFIQRIKKHPDLFPFQKIDATVAAAADDERARLQALADQHAADARATAPASLAEIADGLQVDELWPEDSELVSEIRAMFRREWGMDEQQADARMSRFNFAAALVEMAEVAA